MTHGLDSSPFAAFWFMIYLTSGEQSMDSMARDVLQWFLEDFLAIDNNQTWLWSCSTLNDQSFTLAT